MWEYITILLFIGIAYGVYQSIRWHRRCQYRKEFTHMTESELWQEKDKLDTVIGKYYQGIKADYKPPSKLIERHRCLLLELDRRDLSSYQPQEEESYKERLAGLLDILVYKEFMEQWDKLSKNNEHPRRTAVYYALAREELIKRYQKQCAALSDDKLTAEYTTLYQALERQSISRGSHIRYVVVRKEMAKRQLSV